MQVNSQETAGDSIKAAVAVPDSFPLNNKTGTNPYSVYYCGKYQIGMSAERPSADSQDIRLVFAGAFTLVENNSIDGMFIENGKVKVKNANHHLGGGLLIDNGKLSVIRTFDGKLLTDTWRDSVAERGCSFLQQIQLVRNDSALVFRKDQKLFQRRAVVIFRDGKTAMVESLSAITLQQFADDLVKMQARDALYTDMGGWDEGWYRDGQDKMHTIGLMRGSTDRQSNWIYFYRR